MSAAETEVTNLLAIADQTHVDSGTGVRFKLGGLMRIAIDPAMSNTDALYAITDNTVAGIDLLTLRDETAADLVALVRSYRETDWTCGIGWLNGHNRLPQGVMWQYGFSVSNTAPCGPYALAHEMGHNMGSAHDRETMRTDGHLDYGAYLYSFGYRQDGPSAFATVMAYAVGEQPWLGYFSSPDSMACGASCGVAEVADNVRSLRNLAPVVAAFRGPPGTLSIANGERYETDGPTWYLSLPIRLSGDAPPGDVWYEALVTGGTATAGVDYVIPSQTRGFIPEGQREDQIAFEIIGDTTLEPDETIEVTLTNVTGASVYDDKGVGRILNDDPRVIVSGRLRFDGAPAPRSTISMRVRSLSTAYEGVALDLTPPDFAYEVAMVKGATPEFTIDAPAPFAILPFQLDEVHAAQELDIELHRGVHVSGKLIPMPGHPAPSEPMPLDFRASIAGVYQTMPDVSLQPPDFSYSQWVVPGSWVYMKLTPPAPYQPIFANRPEAREDFVQDIPLSTLPGLLIWGPPRMQEGPPGTHGVTQLVVELSAPAPAGGVQLRYRTIDGTASAGSDYTAVNGVLEIPAGEQVAYTKDITWYGDDRREGDESFHVVVSDIVGATPVMTSVEVILDEQGPRMSKPLPPTRKP